MTHQEEYFAVFGSLKSKKTGAVDYLGEACIMSLRWAPVCGGVLSTGL